MMSCEYSNHTLHKTMSTYSAYSISYFVSLQCHQRVQGIVIHYEYSQKHQRAPLQLATPKQHFLARSAVVASAMCDLHAFKCNTYGAMSRRRSSAVFWVC